MTAAAINGGSDRRGSADAGSRSSDSETLPLSAGAELAHVLVHEAARRAGAAVIFIKGPVANAHRLRSRKSYTDVDVFVEPLRREDVLEVLLASGWRERPASSAQRAFTTHSTTLLHPAWPADIDVHHTFPGMFASDDEVFDALVRESSSLTVGGVEMLGASPAASLVIAVLHSLRSRQSPTHRDEFDRAVELALQWYPDVEDRRAALLPFIDSVSAREPTRPFLDAIGIGVSYPTPPSRSYLYWRIQTDQSSRAGSWLLLILRAPWNRRARLIRDALFPSRIDLLIEHPSHASSSRRASTIRVRMSRLWRGLRALPRAVAVVREGRESARTAPAAKRMADPLPAPPPVPVVEASPLAVSSSAPPPDLDLTGLLVASPRRGEVEFDGAVALLPLGLPSLQVPVILRGTGHAIWQLLRTKSEIAEIVPALAEQYRQPPDLIRPEVERFVRALAKKNLVSEVAT